MDKIFSYIEDEEKLIRIESLVIGVISILLLAITVLEAFLKDSLPVLWHRLIIYLFLEAAWFGIWYYKRSQLPTNTDKSKIGIILLIETESIKQKIRLKSDLVKRINEQISNNNLNDTISLILANNHQAERLNPFLNEVRIASNKSKTTYPHSKIPEKLQTKWNDFQRKTHGHLYIWGEIKERKENEPTYFIETNTMVVHWGLEDNFQRQLSEDISSVWSPIVSFLENAEYQGFNFSGDYIFIAAKYIIGVAAFMCGDADTALKLHKNLLSEFHIMQANPSLPKIVKRVKELISEEYAILARNSLYIDGDVRQTYDYLSESFKYNSNNYSGHLIQAIMEFSQEKNPKKALETIRRMKSFAAKDGTYRYSEGFLLMYQEQFTKALAVYDKIVGYSYEGEDFILAQVLEFNENLLLTEPQKIQCYFILGLLFYKKIGNYPEAIKHIQEFLAQANGNSKYKVLLKRSEAYKTEIEKHMKIA